MDRWFLPTVRDRLAAVAKVRPRPARIFSARSAFCEFRETTSIPAIRCLDLTKNLSLWSAEHFHHRLLAFVDLACFRGSLFGDHGVDVALPAWQTCDEVLFFGSLDCRLDLDRYCVRIWIYVDRIRGVKRALDEQCHEADPKQTSNVRKATERRNLYRSGTRGAEPGTRQPRLRLPGWRSICVLERRRPSPIAG